MKTIIINGSPKGNARNSNTRIISEEFVRGMKTPCDIKCIANSDLEELAHHIEKYDTVIIILPLYIHAMPGIMMNFIEHLKPASIQGKYLGFIIQAGFVETAQEKYVERYFASLAKQLNYNYLGTVSKGEAAGIYMFPKMFKKVLKKINDLGKIYEETHAFDQNIIEELGKPYELSKIQTFLFQLLCDLGLNNVGWHKMLRQNHAFDKRLDRPFL
ncbi:MAG TPA: NAD(P)H dehydrogenase [Lachnoclostridium phytofermentans]|uniref:NAD(P)H dehydrogenase n=1 Tax=Lachnoclostridium phytofermentans TaxID=66219 RepID=A0A3D2X6S8_9FIRM|nr:NAD(P)H-dependent oxidoreductase [Lachnoclostridium sp.]HCL02839.1 NAD(P)H dehydrogenase [Lachnoclostridium phytofermentans]